MKGIRLMMIATAFLLALAGAGLAAGPPGAGVGASPGAGAATVAPTAAPTAGPPGADQRDELLRRQAVNIDTTAVQRFLTEVNKTWEGYGPEITLSDFLDIYRSGEDTKYSPKAIMKGFLNYLVREVLANAGILATIIVLAVAGAILQNLQSAFDAEATGKLAHWVVYLMLVGLAITGFTIAVSAAKQVMDTLSTFMLAMLPTLLTVLAAMGGITSAAIFQPIMVTFVSTAATVMTTIVFPLIFLSAVLDIVSGLNENFKLSGLSGLLRQGANWTLGLTSTLFLGTVAVKGVAGAVADGVTMKTAKFLFGNFVPVVGKMFSDATELIMGSTVLLKNALGMVGAAAIFFIVAFPLLKIMSLVLIYQVAGALVEPMGAGPTAKMLNTMGKSLQMIFASVAVVALMFFVAITVIVGAGNMTVMVR
ncbi:MAG TPA: stage III sporulation protein AE [Symbiobacteriaceae bacterium]|nr:stage III sporulation protein AE [Symbiobacteriaceae bacterium]